MRAPHRMVILFAAMAMLVVVFAVPAQAGAESTLLARINASRSAAGKGPVEMYWDLTDDARAHTSAMLASGGIYHSTSLAASTPVWQALGENVGVGTDANQLHDAFMASASHRGNILGDYNYVGIGTEVDANGLLWATVIFMRADPGLNGGGDTTTTAPSTTSTTTTTTGAVPASEPAPTTTTTTAPTSTAPAAAATTQELSAPIVEIGDAVADAPVTFDDYGHPDGLPAYAL